MSSDHRLRCRCNDAIQSGADIDIGAISVAQPSLRPVALCNANPTIACMLQWFRTQVLSRRPVTFLVLGISFLAFAAGTVNLGMLLMANLSFINQHGWLALREGAAIQLLELLASTYLSMIAYIVFKCCELRLSRWVVDGA